MSKKSWRISSQKIYLIHEILRGSIQNEHVCMYMESKFRLLNKDDKKWRNLTKTIATLPH